MDTFADDARAEHWPITMTLPDGQQRLTVRLYERAKDREGPWMYRIGAPMWQCAGNRITGAVTGPLPSCPNCGGEVNKGPHRPRVRRRPLSSRGAPLKDWLGTAADARLLVLEFGAGFNTPGVIRWPGDHLTRQIPHACLVRVNPTHPETPDDLVRRTLSVLVGADHLLDALTVPHPAPDPTVAS
ncbi:hypothetical protein [Streptomyces sp. NBC_01546]|uniref:hypothetical protein n=1 Tax=Streptomyces sp. NBC_01546 TaxID=2975872 RepID=UPI002F90E764